MLIRCLGWAGLGFDYESLEINESSWNFFRPKEIMKTIIDSSLTTILNGELVVWLPPSV